MRRSRILTRRAEPEGQYDLRAGAAGYAPIVGTIGALAVPAIVVVFTIPTTTAQQDSRVLGFATGLLIVGMIGSLFGAFGLAAIGAERDPTANLVPAIMYISVPVAVSVVAIVGAFEVLATIYTPQSATLIAFMVGAIGLLGVLFCSFAIGDMMGSGPSDRSAFQRWVCTQWIKDRRMAYAWAERVALISAVPAAAGIGLRFADVTVYASTLSINVIVGVGVGLTFVGTAQSMLRTSHVLDGPQRGLRPWEAFSTCLIISCYSLVLLLYLP